MGIKRKTRSSKYETSIFYILNFQFIGQKSLATEIVVWLFIKSHFFVNKYNIIQNEITLAEDCKEDGRSSSEGTKQCECFYQNNCNDVLYYYHSDHIGSSTFLTDALGNPYEFMLYLPD